MKGVGTNGNIELNGQPFGKKDLGMKRIASFSSAHALLIGVGEYVHSSFANLPATTRVPHLVFWTNFFLKLPGQCYGCGTTSAHYL
jgi:hypothetical protein